MEKDFSASSRLFRWTAGFLMAHREAVAYRRLAGVAGVPRLLERRLPDGLVLSLLDARPAAEARGALEQRFFSSLLALLERLRERGVLHGDVMRNALVTGEGDAALVDFGASFVIPRLLLPAARPLLSLAGRYDARFAARLKERLAPHLVTPGDEAVLRTPLPFEGVVRGGERLLHAATSRVARG